MKFSIKADLGRDWPLVYVLCGDGDFGSVDSFLCIDTEDLLRMNYFYYQPDADMTLDEFIDVLDKDGAQHLIGEAVQGAVMFDIKRDKKDIKNACFQLESGYYEFDAKGAVSEPSKRPDWAKTPEQLTQMSLVSQYGLEQLSFMEGIKKLSEQPVDTVQAILKGLLPNLQLRESSQEGSQADASKADKKPRIQNLTAEQFKDFFNLMSSAVKKKKLPSMGYFVDNGVIDPDLKRGFRTYYKIVAGQNMKPDKFTPGDAYFAEISKRLDAIKSEGVDRSYNAISSNISKLDADLPISELTYKFNDWDSN